MRQQDQNTFERPPPVGLGIHLYFVRSIVIGLVFQYSSLYRTPYDDSLFGVKFLKLPHICGVNLKGQVRLWAYRKLTEFENDMQRFYLFPGLASRVKKFSFDFKILIFTWNISKYLYTFFVWLVT